MTIKFTSFSKRYLRTNDAARYLGIAVSTLAKMRLRGDGPEFLKVGPKIVAYDLDSLDGWLASRVRRSTSDACPVADQSQRD